MSYTIDHIGKNWICIRDTIDGISITNDAERVCKEILTKYGDKKILYRDSVGTWDELVHVQGIFVGFHIHNLDDSNYMSFMHVIDV